MAPRVLACSLLFLFMAISTLAFSQTKWKGRNPLAQTSESDNAQTSWQWLNPLPQGNSLRSVFVVDSLSMIAVGDLGTIVKTTNGGSTWLVQHFAGGTRNNLYDVCFFDQTNGVAVGESGTVLKTSDVGETWRVVPTNLQSTIVTIDFYKARHGFGLAISQSGHVLRTIDAGTSWTVAQPLSGNGFKSIACSRDSIAIVLRDSAFRTTNYGQSWAAIPSGVGGSDVCFAGSSPITLMSSSGRFYRSTNWGLDWNTVTIPTCMGIGADGKSISFSSPNLGIATATFTCPSGGGVSIYDAILLSTDGGITWGTRSPSALEGTMQTCHFGTANVAVIIGNGGSTFRTIDGGLTWRELTSGFKNVINCIALSDSSQGALGGNSIGIGLTAFVASTSNGGSSWSQGFISSIHVSVLSITGIAFVDQMNGILVGRGLNELYKTSNAGATWRPFRPLFFGEYQLEDVAFGTPQVGYAVGADSVLKTTDSGMTWGSTPTPNSETLKAVAAEGTNDALVAGTRIIYRTTNGGSQWLPASAFVFAYEGISKKGQLCLAVGGTDLGLGMIVRSTDGGVNWSASSLGPGVLRDVAIVDAQTALIVGDDGRVFKTSDGGTTWVRMNTPTNARLNSIEVIRSGLGYVAYAVGENGTILVSAISPLNSRTWRWGGAVDSSWHEPYNWNPVGVPLPGDSVIIPPSTHSPIIDLVQQQITIGSLNILSGGRLTITSVLPRFVVLGDITVSGTLKVRPPAATTIVVGGSWRITPQTSSDSGFVPASSTVYFTGTGTFERNFYNLVVDTGAVMTSTRSIGVANQGNILRDVNLRSVDTLFLSNAASQALVGKGKIPRGTIQRSIQPNQPALYRFESESTYIQFRRPGTYPSSVFMTAYPDTNLSGLGGTRVLVGGQVNTQTHSIRIDSVEIRSRRVWYIGIPRLLVSSERVDSLIRRFYKLDFTGSPFDATLSLRYEPSEIPVGVPEQSLQIFYDTLTTSIENEYSLPNTYALFQNYPNPFNPTTEIRYQLPTQSHLVVKVFNIMGQLVKTIADGIEDAGGHRVSWDGTNARGEEVSSGIYFYQLNAVATNNVSQSAALVRKMILLR